MTTSFMTKINDTVIIKSHVTEEYNVYFGINSHSKSNVLKPLCQITKFRLARN